MSAPETLAGDLLFGASAVARFLFGDAKPASVKRIYNLRARGRLPLIRVAGQICARRSTLLAWIAKEEARACAGFKDEPGEAMLSRPKN